MNNIINDIVAHKKIEVERKKTTLPFSDIIERTAMMPPTDDFQSRLSIHDKEKILCIAEIKKASPSKGILTKDFFPEKIAKDYKHGGATAISVLTDEKYFKGHPDYILAAKKTSQLPILRKDFIVDEYQIFESRMLGADAILLIASILDDIQLRTFKVTANELSLSVLVECHSKEEIDRALNCGATMIGINNRDLNTFTVDVGLSLKLKNFIPNDCISISESGIRNIHTVEQLSQAGYDALVIGEHFMAQKDRVKAIQDLFGSQVIH